jgi:hypothetical protein
MEIIIEGLLFQFPNSLIRNPLSRILSEVLTYDCGEKQADRGDY